MKSCEICSTLIKYEEEIDIEDWLSVPSKCNKCNKTCCWKCIKTCYTCANKGENSGSFCKECKKFYIIDCKYHRWIVCEKHKDEECGECKANRNYDLRYGM